MVVAALLQYPLDKPKAVVDLTIEPLTLRLTDAQFQVTVAVAHALAKSSEQFKGVRSFLCARPTLPVSAVRTTLLHTAIHRRCSC
jgi:hypothetical protein